MPIGHTHFLNMDLISRESSFDARLIASSSIADSVAAPHIRKAVGTKPAIPYKNGKQNRSPPVSLLAYVCKKAKAWYFTKPTARDMKRTRAMLPIQNNIHKGHRSIGINIIKSTPIKTASAILSSVAPNWLLLLVFLAMYPSRISLTTQSRYAVKNQKDNGFISKRAAEKTILLAVMLLGKYFISNTSQEGRIMVVLLYHFRNLNIY